MSRGKGEGGRGKKEEGGRGKKDARSRKDEVRVRRPRKRFGQHFLEPVWVAKVVDAINPTRDEAFLEIGPGRGALTRPLARRAGHVVAVEIDRDLAATLAAENIPNLRLIRSDFLDLDLEAALKDQQQPLRVAGNLPYNVSSPILFRLLKAANGGGFFIDATLMLQKEVADRLAATPGGKDYGALAIQVALTADVHHLLTLPPGAFRPPPKVTSAVVRLHFHPPSVDVGDPLVFERIVRGIFLQRRKTVANALRPVADTLGHSAMQLLERAGVDGRLRPEALTLGDIARLSRAVL
jgi:16S rRNA (adenine1518-N6/adenine1519-N6)-dimethyltransferase